LGCPDWPGCYGHVYPQADHNFSKAIHEMIHRYFATTLGAIILGLLGWAVWNRKARGQPLKAVALLFVLVCLQGALGALSVTLLLKPLIVTAHLLGGLSTLAILWWLSLTPERRDRRRGEMGLRKFALLGLAALALQIALGGWTSSNYAAVACPDLPTCQQSWWPHMDFRDAFVLWRGLDIDYTGGVLANPARIAIHVTHRIGALALGLILIFVGTTTFARAQSRALRVIGGLLVGAVLLQIGVGMSMVHFGMPLGLATMHNAGAALLVICTVTLLRLLWPEPPEVGVIPLRDVHGTR
jgi:heme a synthase